MCNQIQLTSSNPELTRIFEWARDTAMSCVRDSTHAVGPWYEASLPNRNAFCMRDTAHQCIGAALLGLHEQNENMLGRFLTAIDTTRDYCSYWEIENSGNPAPVDYCNDFDFWYNLPANFDLIDACWRLYELTGSEALIGTEAFLRFVSQTLSEYTHTWQLEPDQVMHRSAFPTKGDQSGRFGNARGIPSYDEAHAEITVGADLLAAHYCALNNTAVHLAKTGSPLTEVYQKRAYELQELIETRWWDADRRRYFDFLYSDGSMGGASSAGNLFLLWFGALNNPERVRAALDTLETDQIEPLSYFPQILYRCGYAEEARSKLQSVYKNTRREYPEASFAVIEAMISGLMGIVPSMTDVRVQTVSGLWEHEEATVTDMPALGGTITVKHMGQAYTRFLNNTGCEITWRAAFAGNYNEIEVNGVQYGSENTQTSAGMPFCFVDNMVRPGESSVARIVM